MTGEGGFDVSSRGGKVPAGVAAVAAEALQPCIALAGRVQLGSREMRTIGIEWSPITVTRPSSISGFRNTYNGSGGGGCTSSGGRTGATRVIAGIFDNGAASIAENASSEEALRLVENQMNNPPITARAPAAMTQVGTTARDAL